MRTLAISLLSVTLLHSLVFSQAPPAPATDVRFESVISIRSGSRTAAVIAIDLNKDNILDIVGTNQGDGTISVSFGESGGRFGMARSYPTSTVGPYETAAADFNGDSYPDLVSGNFGSANGAPYGTTVSVHLNQGDGSFARFVDYYATDTAFDKVRAVATGDFNRDGKADIATASQQSGLHILIGTGDGKFERPSKYRAGGSVHGVVVADFNHDGSPDVALANNGPRGGVNVLLGVGDGTFEATTAYPAGSGTFGLAAGDVNGDKYPDIVTANDRAGSISVLMNEGSNKPGRFADPIDYPATNRSVAVTLADLNDDRKLDVLSSANSGGVTDLYFNRGDGTFHPSIPLDTGGGSYDSCVADFDGDGVVDIASARTSGGFQIFKGFRFGNGKAGKVD